MGVVGVENLIGKKIPRVISIGHMYLTYFNISKGKLYLFQIYICEANNATV